MLTLEGVVVRQADWELRADLAVAEGARVAVMGPSGAGKSTLLAAIGGFVDLAEGRILWGPERIDRLAPAARPVATIFQDNNLFPHLTAFDNVGLGVAPNRRLGHAERERVAAMLGRVGLEGFEGRKPGALSGGQQSRVALARAVLQERPVILLDEPFAALGPALKAEMIDLVVELAGAAGRMVMMVTHDPADAERLGGQTVLVAGGSAAPPVETAALLADPPPALAAYLGQVEGPGGSHYLHPRPGREQA